MRRNFLYILFFFVASLHLAVSHAQPGKVKDSLLAVANRKNPDTASVRALQTLMSNFFNAGLTDSALAYAHQLIALAKGLDHYESLSKAYFNLGSVYTNLYKHDSAFYYTRLAENEALKAKDSFLLVHCYANFASQFRYQSDYETSLEYGIKGARIVERSTDSSVIKIIPSLYWGIGAALTSQKQFLKAIEYQKKALEYTNYPDERRYRILLLLEITDAYLSVDQVEEAEPYMSMAVKENDAFDNIILDLQTWNTQGFYYNKRGKPDLALEAYLHAYRLCDSSKNDYIKSNVANNIALTYIHQKQYNNAQRFAEEANSLSLRMKRYDIAATSFDVLKSIAAGRGDYKLALQHAEQQRIYYDSAINEKTQKQIVSLEKKYETEKKEKDIADLTIANTEKELAVAKRNRWLLGGGLSALLLLVLFGSLLRNSKQKQLLTTKENALHQEQIKFLERQQQVVSLQSMVNGQETERTRIAKDLHDGLGGLFSTIKMYFSTLKHEQPALRENAIFEKSYELIDTASEEVRRIAHNMMPEVLMKLGLMHALQDMCANINAGKLLHIKLQSYGMEKRLEPSTEIMLYRIVQELFNNIIKHADATKVIVQFNREADHLTVTVEDNGRGFNLQEYRGKHAGLETIKSRVNYLNGNMTIDSEEEVGTTVLMEFLLNDDSVTT